MRFGSQQIESSGHAEGADPEKKAGQQSGGKESMSPLRAVVIRLGVSFFSVAV